MVTVQLTLEWTFDESQWSEEKKHIDMLINDPKLCFGYDTINSLFDMKSFKLLDEFALISINFR